MDLGKWKDGIKSWVEKYKYVLLVLLVGITLMTIPDRSASQKQTEQKALPQEVQHENMAEELEAILCDIQGVGNVRVMLSVAKGEQRIYQTDATYNQDDNGTDTRTQTILVTDSERNQTGLIHQINPPAYLGAIVLAQGAEDPVVKLAITDAVAKITGLGTDRISVLKMQ